MKKLKKDLDLFHWLLFPEGPRQRLLVHLLFWTCFVVSHLLFFVPAFSQQLSSANAVWAYIGYYLRYVPLYYFLIFAYNSGRKVTGGLPLFGGFVLVAVLAMHLISLVLYYGYNLVFGLENLPPIFRAIGEDYIKPLWGQQGNALGVFIYDAIDLQLLVLPLGIKLMKYSFAYDFEQVKWQEEKAKTELQALRSRLTPHFIFNVLNSATAELNPYSEPAAYIHQAADLIRFTLYEADKDFIALEKEYHYVKQYVELETMRAELRTGISFAAIPLQVKPTHSVPTLMLLTLVENAFKHSVHSTHLRSFVEIDFKVDGNRLHFSVVNSIPVTLRRSRDGDYGIGLRTIKRALELKFPGDYLLEIDEKEKIFSVRLSLPLDRYGIDSARPDTGIGFD